MFIGSRRKKKKVYKETLTEVFAAAGSTSGLTSASGVEAARKNLRISAWTVGKHILQVLTTILCRPGVVGIDAQP
jgi:hypothetical protein